jgi:hypothetical protein
MPHSHTALGSRELSNACVRHGLSYRLCPSTFFREGGRERERKRELQIVRERDRQREREGERKREIEKDRES